MRQTHMLIIIQVIYMSRNNVSSDNGGNIYLQAKSGEDGVIVHDDGASRAVL